MSYKRYYIVINTRRCIMKYLNKIINLHFIAERTFYNKIKSHDDSLYIINFYYYPLQMYEFRWITIWTVYTFTIKINYFFPISVWIKIVFKTAPLRCLLIIRNIVTIYAKCLNRKIRSFDMKTVYEKWYLFDDCVRDSCVFIAYYLSIRLNCNFL